MNDSRPRNGGSTKRVEAAANPMDDAPESATPEGAVTEGGTRAARGAGASNSDATWHKTSPRDARFQESRAYAARRDWPELPFESVKLAPDARILIVKLSAIGDCVLAAPVAAALRARYPRAHLAWVVGAKSASVVAGNGALDEVLVQKSGARGWLEMLKTVRAARFDAVVDVQGALKSAPLVAAAGAQWRAVSSRAEPIARRAANLIVPIEGTPPHALEQYLRVASAFDIAPDAPRRAVLSLSAAEIAWARDFLAAQNGAEGAAISAENPSPIAAIDAAMRQLETDGAAPIAKARDDDSASSGAVWSVPVSDGAVSSGAARRLVALNPGSMRPIKAWPAANFAILADELEACGIKTLLVGGPNDREIAAQIVGAMRFSPFNAAGQTDLRQLAALLSRCDLLVSADTGPMHIAAGVGTPVVALFGPTDPRRTGPGGDNHLILTRDLGCRPCFQQPSCARFECLTEMAPQDVLESVLRQLFPTGAAERLNRNRSDA